MIRFFVDNVIFGHGAALSFESEQSVPFLSPGLFEATGAAESEHRQQQHWSP